MGDSLSKKVEMSLETWVIEKQGQSKSGKVAGKMALISCEKKNILASLFSFTSTCHTVNSDDTSYGRVVNSDDFSNDPRSTHRIKYMSIKFDALGFVLLFKKIIDFLFL